MNIVDSSGWIEFFTDGPNADFFAEPIEKVDELIVPSLSLFEVFRWVMREQGEPAAIKAAAQMDLGKVVPLDSRLAISAARLGLVLKLPMGDSIMLATARSCGATFWTQDADFEGTAGVKYAAKAKK